MHPLAAKVDGLVGRLRHCRWHGWLWRRSLRRRGLAVVVVVQVVAAGRRRRHPEKDKYFYFIIDDTMNQL